MTHLVLSILWSSAVHLPGNWLAITVIPVAMAFLYAWIQFLYWIEGRQIERAMAERADRAEPHNAIPKPRYPLVD